ncbi:unnamed protein product [Cylindrotheca closterium]|uniref:Uncharacterized protein n=1 Tax=Cylindrotheca closterium TaxID=2856 RepID=A0AAD2G073_9STRA|nr:unnamed protein product [Cylindrotheca closterium]
MQGPIMLTPPSTQSSSSYSYSHSMKSSIGSSRPSVDNFRARAGKRQSKETRTTTSSSSGGASTMHSSQSDISAITMDNFYDEDSTVATSDRSHYRFGPTLDSMPEQKRASDPKKEDVEKSMNDLRFNQSNSSSIDALRLETSNNSSNRFASFSGSSSAQLCAMPRRRSSASGSMGYKPGQPALSETSFEDLNDVEPENDIKSRGGTTEDLKSQCDDTTVLTEMTDSCSMISLQGSVDETDPFQVGLYGDEDIPPAPSESKEKGPNFDSCMSLLGSTDMFDSFQDGFLEEEDLALPPQQGQKNNDSDITKKASNRTSFLRATQGQESSSSMAAMRSSSNSAMFDSFQFGLFDEEEVELPNYRTPRISNRKTNKNTATKDETPRRKSIDMSTMHQSLDLDDVFGSMSI